MLQVHLRFFAPTGDDSFSKLSRYQGAMKISRVAASELEPTSSATALLYTSCIYFTLTSGFSILKMDEVSS